MDNYIENKHEEVNLLYSVSFVINTVVPANYETHSLIINHVP
jgi:hypothetical protein